MLRSAGVGLAAPACVFFLLRTGRRRVKELPLATLNGLSMGVCGTSFSTTMANRVWKGLSVGLACRPHTTWCVFFQRGSVYTCPVLRHQANVGNVTAKEEELDAARKDLEAMRRQVASQAKELEDRDKERQAREENTLGLKVSKPPRSCVRLPLTLNRHTRCPSAIQAEESCCRCASRCIRVHTSKLLC